MLTQGSRMEASHPVSWWRTARLSTLLCRYAGTLNFDSSAAVTHCHTCSGSPFTPAKRSISWRRLTALRARFLNSDHRTHRHRPGVAAEIMMATSDEPDDDQGCHHWAPSHCVECLPSAGLLLGAEQPFAYDGRRQREYRADNRERQQKGSLSRDPPVVDQQAPSPGRDQASDSEHGHRLIAAATPSTSSSAPAIMVDLASLWSTRPLGIH